MNTRSAARQEVPRSRRFWALGIAAIGLLFLSAARDVPDSGERLLIHEVFITNSAGVGTCTAAGTDNLAYGLTGYKLPSSAMAYKINESSFPTYLSKVDLNSAINTSFGAWDAATAKALYSNGGTTTAAPSKKDGINSVGFASLSSGTVGIAYGWANSSNVLTEFGIALSTGYQWSLNPTANGDCGGVASKFDVRDIMMHEIGHPTGLADKNATADHAQSMHGYAAYQELYKRGPAGGDKKGVTSLYGP